MSTTQTDPLMDAIAAQDLDAAVGTKPKGKPGRPKKPAPSFALTSEQLAQLLGALTSARDNTAPKDVSPELADAIGGISELAKQVARQADETARTVVKSNAQHPGKSAFSYPEGDVARPKPDLRYRTFVAHQRINKDELTPVELELLNKFESSKEARGGTWKARVIQNGTTPELHVEFPCRTNDDLAGLPSLVQILTELHYGSDAVDPSALATRMLAMERELAAFKARDAQAAVA